FIDQLNLKSNQIVLILDDDQEIHQVWDQILDSSKINIIHFNSTLKVEEWIMNHSSRNFLLLSDYEIIGEKRTGLDLIKKLSIEAQSVLVTSHFEEISRRNQHVRIIPKMIVPIIKANYDLEATPSSL